MPKSAVVGRERELAALDAELETGGERGTFVLLDGDPGIGKSTLLDVVRQRAGSAGWTVLSGQAAEFERDLPFGVLADALDAHVAALDRTALLRRGVTSLDDLAAILPSVDGPGDAPAERTRAHRALRELLEGLAATRPLLLVLDDLHAADRATLELLAALSHRPPAARVVVLGAHRSCASLGPLDWAPATRITVRPLDDAAAATLLDGALGPQRRAAVLRAAGGNPFFLEQLARMPVTPLGAEPDASGVPPAVMAAIRDEVAALGADGRRLLQGAAVAGEPFDLRLAAIAAELSPDAAAAAVDQAVAAGVVRAAGAPGRFAFRHPLVRRGVYEDAGAGWRLAAHDRLRRALHALGADVTVIAHHAEQAAVVGDEESIAALVAAAAEVASTAPQSAARWYAAALRLLGDGGGERRVELLERRGAALLAAASLDEARDVLLQVPATTPEAIIRLAQVETWLGLVDAAQARLTAGLANAAPDDLRARAALNLQLVVLHDLNLRTHEAASAASAAMAAARQGDDPLVLGAVQAVFAEVLAHTDPASALELLQEAEAAFAGCQDADLAPWLQSVYALGWAATHLERYDRGAAVFERGVRVARAAGDTGMIAMMLCDRGLCALRAGRPQECWAFIDDAVDAARVAPQRRFLWWALFGRAMSLARCGDEAQAHAAVAECEAVAATLPPHPHLRLWTGYGRAFVAAGTGDVSGAAATLRELAGGEDLSLVQNADRHYLRLVTLQDAVERGDLESAEAWAAEGEDWAAESGLMGHRAWADRGRAVVQAAHGDLRGSAASSLRSAAVFARAGSALEAQRSTLLAAGCLAAAGERARAIELMVACEAALHAAGAERDRGVAIRELRRLGRRVQHRASTAATETVAGALGVLSAREREIAQLVADGRTNPQIAAELFLSKKTVEAHLRNIFGKLGVSSRVAVAGLVTRERVLA